MSSITSLLADSYAGIPKSEYLKRLEYAAQPAAQAAQAATATHVSQVNSAVKLDLSPEAQQMIEAQNNPTFDPQVARNLLQEFSQTSGIDIDLDQPITQQINPEEKIGKSTEIGRYFFNHIDEALKLKPLMDDAYEQVEQAMHAKLRAKLPRTEIEKLHTLCGSFSSMTGRINEALQEKGYLPPDPHKKPSYAINEIPDEATQQQDYHQYLSLRFDTFHIPLTSELEAMLQPQMKEFKDTFGQTKYSLEDNGVESVATRIIGLTQTLSNVYPEMHLLMSISAANPLSDPTIYQQRADDTYTAKLKELNDAVLAAGRLFGREGRLEQAQAALNPYLEGFGLRLG